jgi:hypothetical protein
MAHISSASYSNLTADKTQSARVEIEETFVPKKKNRRNFHSQSFSKTLAKPFLSSCLQPNQKWRSIQSFVPSQALSLGLFLLRLN